MEYLYAYLTFLAQAITVVVAILVVLAAIANVSSRRQTVRKGHLEIEKINDRLEDLGMRIREAVLPAAAFKKEAKQRRQAHKKADKHPEKEQADGGGEKKRIFVLGFEGDLPATHVSQLRREVDAVLTEARETDEVVVKVESPGGMVHGYGLAASQLHRLRSGRIPLTVAVDKVAASGGYLMAAVANHVIAAPFAVIGSIGVVAQVPNVHRLLKKNDVDVEVLTAGRYKRTLTVFGENTEEGRAKFIEELEDTHRLFQEFVSEHRPQVDMDVVATGETWYGQRAVDVKLVDEVATSDQYLLDRAGEADIYELRWVEQKKPIERLLGQAEAAFARMAQFFKVREGI
ncbi:MAG: protease SohB [Pseudomonadales bacterium]|jgi:serine protease SohB|nr:protease SohB [Pseudomonadales bacterium]MDP6473120.1 protease SohB [Pseudomonadales bacterium]MDP6826123.1 protease SohB [Pseudomonadales bacterium]MDP6971501.1 protease SohB [Pseudomonadales bacterium]|tara:strand:+ start:525 stop:1559 length:1035 start_codon:yes stop_codon:yes gene_type:complete